MKKIVDSYDSRDFYNAIKTVYSSKYQQKTTVKSRENLRYRQEIKS